MVAARCGPAGRSAPTGCAATRRSPTPATRTRRGAISVHPYLRLPGVAVDDILLQVPAKTRVLADSRLLPIGAVKVAGTEYDFTEPRRIGTSVLDTTFGDLDYNPDGGSAVTIAAPDSSAQVEVWGDENFKWWQIFTGDTLHGERFRRSVAIEPMTCPPDAFRSGRDLIVLEPGRDLVRVLGDPALMEFDEVVRRRRMVRSVRPGPAGPGGDRGQADPARAAGAVGRLLAGLGISGAQEQADRDRYWSATASGEESRTAWLDRMRTAPLIIVPMSNKSVYLDRYASADKGWTDRDEAHWPVPYWDIDTGFAALLIHLTAVDQGLGVLFHRAAGRSRCRTSRRRSGFRRSSRRSVRSPWATVLPTRGHRHCSAGTGRWTMWCIMADGPTPGNRRKRTGRYDPVRGGGACRRDLQSGPGRCPVPRSPHDAEGMGGDSAAADPAGRPDHHQARAGAGQAARRGLDVLRRPVPARRGVSGLPLSGGRPAPGVAGGAAAAQPDPRPGAGGAEA